MGRHRHIAVAMRVEELLPVGASRFALQRPRMLRNQGRGVSDNIEGVGVTVGTPVREKDGGGRTFPG
jgi:hypothetical protein